MKTPTITQTLGLWHVHRRHQLALAARFMRIRAKQNRRELRKALRRLIWARIKYGVGSMFKVRV